MGSHAARRVLYFYFVALSVGALVLCCATRLLATEYRVEYWHDRTNNWYTSSVGAPGNERSTFVSPTGVEMNHTSTTSFYVYGSQLQGSSNVHSEAYARDGATGILGTVAASGANGARTTARLVTADARMVFDDLIITKTDDPGATGTVNNIFMNVHVSGSLLNTTAYQSYQLLRAWQSASSWTIPGNAGGGNLGGVFYGQGDPYNINGTFTIEMGSAWLGQPTVFGIGQSLALTAISQGATVTNSGDFMSTVTFAKGGPAFNLPAGYTANSASAGIVNNVFVGVPEPAAIGILALGGLAVLRRRRIR